MHTKAENRDFMTKELQYQVRDIVTKLTDEEISNFRKSNIPSSSFQDNIVQAIRDMGSVRSAVVASLKNPDWDIISVR